MSISLNTHDYDKDARIIYEDLIAADPQKNEPLLPFPIVLQQLLNLINSLPSKSTEMILIKKQACQTLILFKNDPVNNKDQYGLTVEDILPRIWRAYLTQKQKIEDNILYFIEQLSDIKTMGSCNNGRINRLLQVYNCLVN
jgi:hypothetical protein